MSLNQIIDKDPNQTLVCDETLNLKGNQLRLKKKIVVPDGEFTNVDTVTINGAPYPGGAFPALIANKLLRTNGTATAVLWGDVPHGPADSVLQTDSTGTSVVWRVSPNFPGNLTVNGNTTTLNLIVNGSSTLTNVVTINSDLQFNSVSGAVGSVITKTSTNDQAWVLPLQTKIIRYAAFLALQDLNSGAGPTAVTFNTTPIYSTAVTNVGTVTGITQPSITQFLVGETGVYDISINGFINRTSTGPVSSFVSLTAEVNGVEILNSCVVVNTLSFVGNLTSIPITAGNLVRILARRIIGTGSFNTYGPPAASPNFTSTIAFTLIN